MLKAAPYLILIQCSLFGPTSGSLAALQSMLNKSFCAQSKCTIITEIVYFLPGPMIKPGNAVTNKT